jgi:hypothetical protein
VREIFASEGKEKALDFYKREIDSGRPLIVSFIYDKEGRNPQRARERRDSDSYFAIGYLQLSGGHNPSKNIYLILYDGKQIIAKNYMGSYPNIIILGARVK